MSESNRILFVDDEPGILEGLRNSLRKQRGRWDMVFVASGAAALAELEKAPFDVVVCDMRMPQMDGPELLARVKLRYPATARIVLSGQADQDAVLRALPVAQQFLTKPCEPAQLRAVIERTCGVYTMLHQGRAREVIGALETLPSVPRTYDALRQTVHDPHCDMSKVVAIVEQDPAMCVKILQLVNSAYFGLARPMSSIRQAIAYLGLELLKALALSAHIFATMESARLSGLCLDQMQRHALATARLMRDYFPDPKRGDEAFTAALVHDVGKIILALSFGGRYGQVSQRVQCEGLPCHVVEAALLGVTHAEVGACLLGMWGLPFAVVEAVAYHHRPELWQPQPMHGWLLAALHVADTVCDGAQGAALDRAFIERAGCTVELPRWLELAAAARREMPG